MASGVISAQSASVHSIIHGCLLRAPSHPLTPPSPTRMMASSTALRCCLLLYCMCSVVSIGSLASLQRETPRRIQQRVNQLIETNAIAGRKRRLSEDAGNGSNVTNGATSNLTCVCHQGWSNYGPPDVCINYIVDGCFHSETLYVPESVCNWFFSNDSDYYLCTIIEALELTAMECGTPYLKYGACERVFGARNSSDGVGAFQWTTDDVAVFLYFASSDFGLPPEAPGIFHTNNINGLAFFQMDQEAVREMGFPVGTAEILVQETTRYKELVQTVAPSQVIVRNIRTLKPGAPPTNVSLAVTLLKLIDVDQNTFDFEVELKVVLSWEDERIDTACAGAGNRGQDIVSGDVCGTFWTPPLLWAPTTAQPEVIDDSGLYTLVGASSVPAEGEEAAPDLARSIAWRSFSVVGRYMGKFDYRHYPKDEQTMNVTVRLPNSYTADAVRLVGNADLAPDVATPPIWQIAGIGVVKGLEPSVFGTSAAQSDQVGPLFDYLRSSDTQIPDNYATFTVSIRISRLTFFYWMNYILVVSVLVLLSFFTFSLSAAMIEARLSISLTVILAINVFQIVLFEKTPDTGYLTSMHWFTIFSTIFVALVAMENLFVYLLHKRLADKKAAISFVKSRLKSKRGQRAAKVIQRTVKTWLRRHRLRQLLAESYRQTKERQRQHSELADVVLDVQHAASSASGTRAVAQSERDAAATAAASLVRTGKVSARWRAARYQERAAMWAVHYLDYTSLVLFPLVYAVATALAFTLGHN